MSGTGLRGIRLDGEDFGVHGGCEGRTSDGQNLPISNEDGGQTV